MYKESLALNNRQCSICHKNQPNHIYIYIYIYIYHHHHHHVVLVARISLTLSCHFSQSFIASGWSSGLHPVSSHSCWMYVRAGRPAFARPCVGVHKSASLMSSSLLLQQCPACLVRLTWRMLRAILNKSWRQHPTRHQLYGHLPPITKTIQVRRTRQYIYIYIYIYGYLISFCLCIYIYIYIINIKSCIYIYIHIYIYEQDLIIDNQPGLICHKAQPNQIPFLLWYWLETVDWIFIISVTLCFAYYGDKILWMMTGGLTEIKGLWIHALNSGYPVEVTDFFLYWNALGNLLCLCVC